MPRTIAIASQVYPARPGEPYGPFQIDSFTKDDVNRIEVDLTVEGWPDVPLLARLIVSSNNGARMTVNIPGRPRNRDGMPAAVMHLELSMIADGVVINGVPQPTIKRAVSGATVTVEVFADVRTAIAVRAV